MGCQPNHLSLSINTFVKPYFVSFTSDSTIFSIRRPILLYILQSIESQTYTFEPMTYPNGTLDILRLRVYGGLQTTTNPKQEKSLTQADPTSSSRPKVVVAKLLHELLQSISMRRSKLLNILQEGGLYPMNYTYVDHPRQEKSKNSFVGFQ